MLIQYFEFKGLMPTKKNKALTVDIDDSDDFKEAYDDESETPDIVVH